MPDKMQKDLSHFDHSILRKCPKTPKMVNFDHIFDDLSELSDQNDLIPLEYCQASSDTNLEYQQGVDWLQMARTASKMAQKGQEMAQNGQFPKILACMWCGYSKLVSGVV